MAPGRATPSPPGTPWTLNVLVRDTGKQEPEARGCGCGAPCGSSGAPSPPQQKGQGAREAPRGGRDTPRPAAPAPRRPQPPAEVCRLCHFPPPENQCMAALAKCAGCLPGPATISKKPLGAGCPAGLGHPHARTRPGAGPPRPSPPPPGGPSAPHVLPTHSTGNKAHGPHTDGLSNQCPQRAVPIVTQGGCQVEATRGASALCRLRPLTRAHHLMRP